MKFSHNLNLYCSPLAKNQNWSKACPWMGAITLAALFLYTGPDKPAFWALINIPLYLFHQTEEHYWPGGFKKFMNQTVFGLPEGQETLTDIKVFWINILLVWFAFAVFGILSFFNIGFGLLIIVFSVINCLTHIFHGIKLRSWNPGLAVASLQFAISIYAGYFITSNGLSNPVLWWVIGVLFSIVVHVVLFRLIMNKE